MTKKKKEKEKKKRRRRKKTKTETRKEKRLRSTPLRDDSSDPQFYRNGARFYSEKPP